MSVRPMALSESGAAGRFGRARALSRAGDGFLAFLQLPAGDLGEGPIRDAELGGDGLGLAVRAEDEHTPGAGNAAPAGGLLSHLLIVLGALLWGQDGADLLTAGLPDLLALDSPLAVGRAARHQGAELVPPLLEYGLELLLLLGDESERLHEPVPDLLDGGRWALSPGRRGARGHRDLGRLARRPIAEGRVRHLEHAVLLVHEEAHIGRHAGEQL